MTSEERIYIVDRHVLPCVSDYLQSRGVTRIVTWDRLMPLEIDPETTDIVFIQQPPPSTSLKLRARSFSLLNIEQLTRPMARDWLVSSLKKWPQISTLIDYSQANVDIISKSVPLKFCVEPFLYVDPPFPDVIGNNDYVAFVGAMSKRRQKVLDMLKGIGFTVCHIKAWGKERDAKIAECRVLLNIHYADDYKVFESFRCVPWVRHPFVKVVSETSLGQEKESSYPHIIWANYDDLVQSVNQALRGKKIE
jgi:hypothetical protein